MASEGHRWGSFPHYCRQVHLFIKRPIQFRYYIAHRRSPLTWRIQTSDYQLYELFHTFIGEGAPQSLIKDFQKIAKISTVLHLLSKGNKQFSIF